MFEVQHEHHGKNFTRYFSPGRSSMTALDDKKAEDFRRHVWAMTMIDEDPLAGRPDRHSTGLTYVSFFLYSSLCLASSLFVSRHGTASIHVQFRLQTPWQRLLQTQTEVQVPQLVESTWRLPAMRGSLFYCFCGSEGFSSVFQLIQIGALPSTFY